MDRQGEGGRELGRKGMGGIEERNRREGMGGREGEEVRERRKTAEMREKED